jgi:hypothetical protein
MYLEYVKECNTSTLACDLQTQIGMSVLQDILFSRLRKKPKVIYDLFFIESYMQYG